MSKTTLIGIMGICFFASANAFTFGAGGVYKNLLVENGDAYPGIVADAYFKVLPFLGIRVGLVDVDMPEGGTSYFFGLHTGADLMLTIPVEGIPISPYILFGATYSGNGVTKIDLDGGVGFDYFFTPQMGFYLEGAIHYFSYDVAGYKTDGNPLYFGGGLKIKVPML